ncbi:hypothetical protein HDV05_007943, partial [Chytridiales sp. JEL 0842]
MSATNNTNDTYTSSYCSPNRSHLCVTATYSPQTSTLTYSLNTTSTGWIGFGMGGSHMVNSVMLVAWRNSKGGLVSSWRIAGAHQLPRVLAVGADGVFNKTSVYLNDVVSNATHWSFSIERPLSLDVLSGNGAVVNSVSLTGPTKHMWAMSSSLPVRRDDPRSEFRKHGLAASFELNLSPNKGGDSDMSPWFLALNSTVPGPNIASGTFCTPSSTSSQTKTSSLCVYAVTDKTSQGTTLHLTSDAEGWVSLGLGGSSKTTAKTFLFAWVVQAENQIRVSQRTLSEESARDTSSPIFKKSNLKEIQVVRSQ